MARKLPALLKNKYMLVTAAFVVWIIFFDRNDLITQAGYMQQLHSLCEQKGYLQQEISRIDSDRAALQSDPATLQKFAREKYLMKKNGEDVYLLDGKTEEEK